MNTQVAQFAGPHSARSQGRTRSGMSENDSIPVLIRVPSLTTPRSRMSARAASAPRVRRRLKSEVRVAAATLIFAMPLSWGLFSLVGWNGGSGLNRDLSAATASDSSRVLSANVIVDRQDEPRATISLRTPETATTTATPADEMEPPVAVPAGYLVPDEAPEEKTSDAGH